MRNDCVGHEETVELLTQGNFVQKCHHVDDDDGNIHDRYSMGGVFVSQWNQGLAFGFLTWARLTVALIDSKEVEQIWRDKIKWNKNPALDESSGIPRMNLDNTAVDRVNLNGRAVISNKIEAKQ